MSQQYKVCTGTMPLPHTGGLCHVRMICISYHMRLHHNHCHAGNLGCIKLISQQDLMEVVVRSLQTLSCSRLQYSLCLWIPASHRQSTSPSGITKFVQHEHVRQWQWVTQPVSYWSQSGCPAATELRRPPLTASGCLRRHLMML